MRRQQISSALAGDGLILRGGFNFEPDESVPAGPSGRPARAALLVGQAGTAPWRHFRRWREGQPADLENPLDTWCRLVIGKVAEDFGARAVSPSDRPYLPFQQWAMRAEGLRPSPLGILMHPEYGLWHAYRGALQVITRDELLEQAGGEQLSDRELAEQAAALDMAVSELGG